MFGRAITVTSRRFLNYPECIHSGTNVIDDPEFRRLNEKLMKMLSAIPVMVMVKAGLGISEFLGKDRYTLKDEGGKYVIIAEVPGASKEDVRVYAREDMIYVYAERKVGLHIESIPKKYRIKVKLEEPIDVEGVKAKYENGLLIIEAPKKAPGREIEVK